MQVRRCISCPWQHLLPSYMLASFEQTVKPQETERLEARVNPGGVCRFSLRPVLCEATHVGGRSKS